MSPEVAAQEPADLHVTSRRRPIWPIVLPAVLALLALAIDLASRQIARQSLIAALAGLDLAPRRLLLVAGAVVAAAVLALSLAHRRRHPRFSDAVVVLVLLGAFCAGLVTQLALGARLQSDGFYYFAHLRSIWFDHDLDLANDYRLLGLGDKPHLFTPTPTGHAQSAWTIGPAIAWSPFFGAGHVAAGWLAASGTGVATDGTSAPYRQAVCVAGLFYGLVGTWFIYLMTRRVASPGSAAVAAFAVVAGSFQIWYLVKEPTMTHAPSMAAVAAFGWLWLATRDHRSAWQWAALGLLAGFAATIRWQNVLFALLPAMETLGGLVSALRVRDAAAARRLVAGGIIFTAAAGAGFLPQMIAWQAIYGSWLAVSPIGPEIRWGAPHVVDILWSSRNGLFSWSPLLYVGAVGLVMFAYRDRPAGLPMVAAFAVMVYFNASIQDWWGSASFGMRRFDGVLPLLAIGLAVAMTGLGRLVAARPALVVGSIVAVLLVWNAALVSVAVSGRAPVGDAVSFGRLAAAQVEAIHGWIGYPFSYPPGLLFAWRSGLSPARYDRLGPGRFLGDPTRPYGRVDIGNDDRDWLLEGWHAPEKEGAVTFRWAQPLAGLLIPLDHAAPLGVQLRIRPFTLAAQPTQQVIVEIGGRQFGPFALQPGWQDLRFDTPREAWRGGVNRMFLVFGHGARPSEVGRGGDSRLLSAAVDWVRVQVQQ